jgi:hypothetical protein
VPDTPTSRRCQVVRDPASGASTARHPPRPARRDPRGPPAPAARVRTATPRSRAEGRRQRRRDGGATGTCGTGTPHGRKTTATLRPRPARAVEDGCPGQRSRLAGPRRTPHALPARVVEARPPRRGEPACAGGAPSRVGWCSPSGCDARSGMAGFPGSGTCLGGFASRALGAQPLINLSFCPDNAILVGFSGSFASYPLSAF